MDDSRQLEKKQEEENKILRKENFMLKQKQELVVFELGEIIKEIEPKDKTTANKLKELCVKIRSDPVEVAEPSSLLDEPPVPRDSEPTAAAVSTSRDDDREVHQKDRNMEILKRYVTFRGGYKDEEKQKIASHLVQAKAFGSAGGRFMCKCPNAKFVCYREFIRCASVNEKIFPCYADAMEKNYRASYHVKVSDGYKCYFNSCKNLKPIANAALFKEHVEEFHHLVDFEKSDATIETVKEYAEFFRKYPVD